MTDLAEAADREAEVAPAGLCTGRPVRVVVGEKRHYTIDRSLRLLGLGTGTVSVVPADSQGRMIAGELRGAVGGRGPTIVCAQAGEVNTAAFDPFAEIADACAEAGAWLPRRRGLRALGLGQPRAAASPRRHRARGLVGDRCPQVAERALRLRDRLVREPEAHRGAMSVRAAYLVYGEAEEREQMDWNPESSRRARGFPVYAAIRSLRRSGIRAMIERCCEHARGFAEELEGLGAEILNDVVLNQVLLRFESDAATTRSSAASRRAARHGWAARRGPDAKRFASPSRTGRRPKRTSSAR